MWPSVAETLAVRAVKVGSSAWGVEPQRGGASLPEGSEAPTVLRGALPYGSGTSAVTLPISSNSVFEVYSLIEIVP